MDLLSDFAGVALLSGISHFRAHNQNVIKTWPGLCSDKLLLTNFRLAEGGSPRNPRVQNLTVGLILSGV